MIPTSADSTGVRGALAKRERKRQPQRTVGVYREHRTLLQTLPMFRGGLAQIRPYDILIVSISGISGVHTKLDSSRYTKSRNSYVPQHRRS